MILSVDPGACSGWALLDGCRVHASGEVHPDSAKGLAAAHDLISTAECLVIEGMGYIPRGCRYDTAYGMGVHAGLWLALARLRGIPIEIVHPDTWQRAMLHPGGRNPGRAMLKRLSVARATKLAGRAVKENQADALVMGEWYATTHRTLTLGPKGMRVEL
jgi:hypothetical protein